jgi:hypothetical protein
MIGKSKMWVYGKGIGSGQILLHLQNGINMVVDKSHEKDFARFAKINPGNLYILATGFTSGDCLKFLKDNSNIILNHHWEEAEINALIKKGKNKIVINGKGFKKEQLLVFAAKGANVVLDHTLSVLDINNFLNQPNKNILIKGKNFSHKDLLEFLEKGASVIIYDGISEQEKHPLISAGKQRVIITTSEEIWDV